MSSYETDNEQMELLKKWWKDQGKWLIIFLIVGLTLGFGWRLWQQQQIKVRQQASLLYQQLIVADSQNNRDAVGPMSVELTTRYPHSEYAALGNLVAAKSDVLKNNLEEAAKKLQWTVEHAQTSSIRQTARLREVRIFLSQNKIAEAQKLLKVVDDPSFQPVIDEVQGDVYLAAGDRVKARQSYQAAQMKLSNNDTILAMKLAQP